MGEGKASNSWLLAILFVLLPHAPIVEGNILVGTAILLALQLACHELLRLQSNILLLSFDLALNTFLDIVEFAN